MIAVSLETLTKKFQDWEKSLKEGEKDTFDKLVDLYKVKDRKTNSRNTWSKNRS